MIYDKVGVMYFAIRPISNAISTELILENPLEATDPISEQHAITEIVTNPTQLSDGNLISIFKLLSRNDLLKVRGGCRYFKLLSEYTVKHLGIPVPKLISYTVRKQFWKCIEIGDISAFKLFLEFVGVSTKIIDSQGRTALMQAVIYNQLELVKYCITVQPKPNINDRDNYGYTALIHAVRYGRTHICTQLIQAQADVNLQDYYGDTALMYAVISGHIDIVDHLLNVQADVNIQNNRGETALMIAAISNHLVIMKKLIAAGVQIYVNDRTKRTILKQAVEKYGHLEIVTQLIEAGADLSIEGPYGSKALLYAAANGYTEKVVRFIAYGANINATNKSGETALMIAARLGDTITLIDLIQFGANVNLQDRYGKTALIHAVHGDDELGVIELLQAGADRSLRDTLGYTALTHAAIRAGTRLSLVKLLLTD